MRRMMYIAMAGSAMMIWPTAPRAAGYEMGDTITTIVTANVTSAVSTSDCEGDNPPEGCVIIAGNEIATPIDYEERRAQMVEFFAAERAEREENGGYYD